MDVINIAAHLDMKCPIICASKIWEMLSHHLRAKDSTKCALFSEIDMLSKE